MATFNGTEVRSAAAHPDPTLGSSLPYRSSRKLNWFGVEVCRYRVSAGETPEHSFARLAVFLSHVDNPVNGELRVAGRKLHAKLGNNTVSIAPPGLPISTRRDGPGEVTVIFFEQSAIAEIARSATGTENPEILFQYAIEDPLIRSIGTMLDAEIMTDHPGPRIYAESLASALAAHIFTKYSNPVFRQLQAAGLNRTQLSRSIEFIGENLHRDLTLAEIAMAANMSKFHFAKSFRHVMGIPPHQYLVKLRVEKARKLLAVDTLSVEEVASRVGYSDKAHFASQFRRIVGISPNGYRLSV